MVYNLYSVQGDGSKVLLSAYADLSSAQAAMTDVSVTYSIEQWDGADVTVLV